MTKEIATTTPVADKVRQYLDHDAWNYDVREREGVVMFGATVTLPNGEFRVSFDADDGREPDEEAWQALLDREAEEASSEADDNSAG